MKSIKEILIWTILCFVSLTLLTMKNEAASDGINAYGFPFPFYTNFNGKCVNCFDQYSFKILNLLADIALVTVFVFLAFLLRKKKFHPAILLLTTSFIFTSCSSSCDCATIDRQATDGETLYKICKCIVDNNLVSKPANPCDFKVREIKEDTLNGKSIYRVILTCCYMGDEALIDKQTNEVIGYIPSDK